MSDPVQLSTQYSDLKGTIAIDRADGGGDLLRALAAKVELPRGYHPVGFSIFYASSKDGGGQTPFYHLTVYAIDSQLAATEGELGEYMRNHGPDVPVFRSDATIEPSELFGLLEQGIKRLHVIFQSRGMEGGRMVEIQDN